MGYSPSRKKDQKTSGETKKKSVPASIAELLVGSIPPVEENTQSLLDDQKKKEGTTVGVYPRCGSTVGVYPRCGRESLGIQKAL